jgi:glycosyltransferase involved in cell wall biosynthesis
MNDGKTILFIQNKTHKAGAQTALYSLLTNGNLCGYRLFLLSSGEGWLTRACRETGVGCALNRFPSSRSVPARLYKNLKFAGAVKRELGTLNVRPDIVHGNDYLEGLLALKLAKAFGAASAITLRSSMMTRRDYYKYQCDRFDLITAIGDELFDKALRWSGGKRVVLINDGLYDYEFSKQKEKPGEFPDRVLVIGDQSTVKGWKDIISALQLLSRDMQLNNLRFDFVSGMNSLQMEQYRPDYGMTKDVKLNFIDGVEQFKALVRNYDLVINPSRSESFGRAAMEVLAAGVTLVSSRTGAVKDVITNSRLLFRPGDPHDMARVLKDVIVNWKELDLDLSECQNRIRAMFNIDRWAGVLTREYEMLTA